MAALTILLATVIATPLPTLSEREEIAALKSVHFTLNTMRQDGQVERKESDSIPLSEKIDALVPYGTKGSQRFTIHGGFGADIAQSENLEFLGGVAWSHFIEDGLSFDVELNGLYFNQEGTDAGGINAAALFRWHFINESTWSMFVDGGIGILLTTDDVPGFTVFPNGDSNHGSQFNFTPQAGMGITYDIGESRRLITGVRWYHVSNANTFERNPGRDHVYLHFGVSVPF